MSGDGFFEELQMEFLNESAFLMENYEESMMSLENGQQPQEDLCQIFRVAHSVKGGAAAVGLSDLSKFAHVMEDLLAVLRGAPELVNSDVISLLLKSGDELKKRIHALQKGQNDLWDPAVLVDQLVRAHEDLAGKNPASAVECKENLEPKPVAPDDFFTSVQAEKPPEVADNTNHELLAELLSQMSPEDRAAYEKENIMALAPAVAAKQPEAAVSKESATPKAAVKSAPGGKSGGGAIKVDTARVDSVLDAVGELVVLKNQLVHDEHIRSGGNVRLEAIVDQLDKAVRELYEKTLSIRMTPLKSLFIKIQRIVRDVSLTLNKPVDLELVGEETEVERTVFELLNDPLVHLVRNAMDHGIEKAEIRKERGKSVAAKVQVSAKQSGGNVLIEISDDGGGIPRDRVLKKALEKGLIPTHVDPSTLSDEQVFQFIFSPGFSTAEKVSDLSGRGVGLDVVKSNLEKIAGKINITSKVGVGTTFRLTIPLTTAITDGILVALDGERYILPIHSIHELVRVLPKDYTEIPGGGKVAKIREILVPVINIRKVLGTLPSRAKAKQKVEISEMRREESMLVVIESFNGRMALPVDDIIGQAQVVVKPLTTGQSIPEVAGAAILGDGRTVLILDPNMLVSHSLCPDARGDGMGRAA